MPFTCVSLITGRDVIECCEDWNFPWEDISKGFLHALISPWWEDYTQVINSLPWFCCSISISHLYVNTMNHYSCLARMMTQKTFIFGDVAWYMQTHDTPDIQSITNPSKEKIIWLIIWLQLLYLVPESVNSINYDQYMTEAKEYTRINGDSQ